MTSRGIRTEKLNRIQAATPFMASAEAYLRKAGFDTVASQSDKHHMVLGVATKLTPKAATALAKPVISSVTSMDNLIRRHAPGNFVAVLLVKGSVASVRYSGPENTFVHHARELEDVVKLLQPGKPVNVVRVNVKE